MDSDTRLRDLRRAGTGLSFVLFSAIWVFAFAVHPDLLHPQLMLGPEELVRRAHGDDLLQAAHALVTLTPALLVVMTMHFMSLLDSTRLARAGVVGAALAVLGAVLLAADKGAMCLTMTALDTVPERQFEQMVPGLVAIFSFEGLMPLVLGMALMPVGVMVQAVALWRAQVLPGRAAGPLVVSLLFIAFPDGAEIVNLTAAVVMASVLVPYGLRLVRHPQHPADRSPGTHEPARMSETSGGRRGPARP